MDKIIDEAKKLTLSFDAALPYNCEELLKQSYYELGEAQGIEQNIMQTAIKMLKEKHEHVQKLPGVKLPEDMEFTTDLESAVSGKAYLILAVPSVFTRSTAKSMAPFVKEGQIIVCVAKGIEEETLMPLTDIVEQEIPQAEVAVMCGPSHAEEVGIGLPTTVVAGAKKRAVAEGIQDIFMNNVFRVYTLSLIHISEPTRPY